jgi:predicted pyridoxine 5'-phosphate oxidase superfamily flavin-nucleotide-binding protein
MEAPDVYPSDVAFTPSVKALQAKKGSRERYRRMEESGSWRTRITPALAGFIEAQTSVFLATANALGQPYIQHRGGPPGFLRVLDEKTIGFVDFSGNRQYVTQGNLKENARAHLFLMDYVRRSRIKLWGEASFVDSDPDSVGKLMPPGYTATPEGVILFTVSAWDANCSKHIPQRFWAGDVALALNERDEHIAALQAEVNRLSSLLNGKLQQ